MFTQECSLHPLFPLRNVIITHENLWQVFKKNPRLERRGRLFFNESYMNKLSVSMGKKSSKDLHVTRKQWYGGRKTEKVGNRERFKNLLTRTLQYTHKKVWLRCHRKDIHEKRSLEDERNEVTKLYIFWGVTTRGERVHGLTSVWKRDGKGISRTAPSIWDTGYRRHKNLHNAVKRKEFNQF